MQIEITKQSEKDFRFLLSRLSHEIRNPVTLINSELQLMASSHPELCSYRQWDSLMAVSYTHLDVYKRQHLHIDFLICICYNASRRKEIASPCRQKE